MQPPRQMLAISPNLSFQLYSFLRRAHELETLGIGAYL